MTTLIELQSSSPAFVETVNDGLIFSFESDTQCRTSSGQLSQRSQLPDSKYPVATVNPELTDTFSALSSHTYSDWSQEWAKAQDQLTAIYKLNKDWGGSGETPPTSQAILFAEWWISKLQKQQPDLRPPDYIVPGGDQEIGIVWEGSGYQIEALITEPKVIEWMVSREGDSPDFFETNGSEKFPISGSQLFLSHNE